MAQPKTLLVVFEAVLYRDRNGLYWSPDLYGPEHWRDYLLEFNRLVLVARVKNVPDDGPAGEVFDPQYIHVAAMPFYQGAQGLLRALPTLIKRLSALSRSNDLVLVRLPGAIGSAFGFLRLARGRSFAVQLIGDIDEVLRGPGFSALIRLARRPATAMTRWLCLNATAISYVTGQLLQAKYPAHTSASAFSISNVRLLSRDYAVEQRRLSVKARLELVFCGTLSQRYKGLDVLIQSVALLLRRGLKLRLSVAGEGRYREELVELTRNLGVCAQVKFCGLLSRADVLQLLDQSDAFVLPSRTEGLPRAMLEAMARALPCIGTRVGGIPELIEDAVLVEPDNPVQLADAIHRLVTDAGFYEEQSRKCLATARLYEDSVLSKRRREFLRQLQRGSQCQSI